MVRVARDRDRGVDLANIEGPLSQIRGSAIRTALLELVATGPGKLVLNLAGVTFVDSHGLATLVSVWKAMKRREGRVVLAAIPSDIEALIELTRLQSLFEIFPSDTTAIVNLELHDTASDRELRLLQPSGQPDRPSGSRSTSYPHELAACLELPSQDLRTAKLSRQ